jgi:hypothetical protein
LTAVARTRTRTSPRDGTGSGTSRSSSTSGPPGRAMTIARMTGVYPRCRPRRLAAHREGALSLAGRLLAGVHPVERRCAARARRGRLAALDAARIARVACANAAISARARGLEGGDLIRAVAGHAVEARGRRAGCEVRAKPVVARAATVGDRSYGGKKQYGGEAFHGPTLSELGQKRERAQSGGQSGCYAYHDPRCPGA